MASMKNDKPKKKNTNNILSYENIFPDIVSPSSRSSSSSTTKKTRTTITTTTVIPSSANFPSFPSPSSSSSSTHSSKTNSRKSSSPFASFTKSLQSQSSSGRKPPPQRQQSGGGGGRQWSKYPGANIQKKQPQPSKTTTQPKQKPQQPPPKSPPKRTKKNHSPKTTKEYPLPSTIYLRNYLPPLPPSSSSSFLPFVETKICTRSVSEEQYEEEFLSLSIRQKRKIGNAFDRMNTPVILQIVQPCSTDDGDDMKAGKDAATGANNDDDDDDDKSKATAIEKNNGKDDDDEEENEIKNEKNIEISDKNILKQERTKEKSLKTEKDDEITTITKDDKKEQQTNKEKIIFSATASNSKIPNTSSSIISLHPHWDYINEQCCFFDEKINDFIKEKEKKKEETLETCDDNKKDEQEGKKEKSKKSGDKKNWEDAYQSLKLRILVNINLPPLKTEDDKSNILTQPILLAEIPIHPTQLRRLPPTTPPSTNTHSSSSHITPSIPQTLPPNSIIIQYTDDTYRVHPSLYHLLLSKGVIEECLKDENVLDDIMEENKRRRRFDDDVFKVLDHEEEEIGGDDEEEENGGMENALRSPSSLLNDVDPYFQKEEEGGSTHPTQQKQRLLQSNGTTTKTENGITDTTASASSKKNQSSAFSNDDLFDLLGTNSSGNDHDDDDNNEPQKEKTYAATTPTKSSQALASTENGVIQERKEPLTTAAAVAPSGTTTTTAEEISTESKVYNMELQNQIMTLQCILKEEEESLQMDRELLCREMDELKLSLEQEQDIEKETVEIQEHAEKELEHLVQAEFVLEARRVKLLRDLREIYPIRAFPDNTFAIRGIKLPTDILDPTVPDEIVSAALGFACHLVFMCSKYLSIPLRYRLICNSSRSAVQDDGNGVFPLFKERVIDLKQLERAVILLERDIECLLYTRGISFSPLWHMLAKLDQLFERTTKGGGTNP